MVRMVAYVLLVSLVVPTMGGHPMAAQPVADATAAPLVVEDPQGDVRAGLLFALGAAAPVKGHLDIVALRIGPDTATTLPLEITFAEWDPVVARASQAASYGDISCGFRWSYPPGDSGSYSLGVYQTFSPVPPEHPDFAQSWLSHEVGDDRQYTDEGVEARFDPATATLRVELDKAYIPAFPGARPAAAGDILVFDYVQCVEDLGLYGYHFDRVDDVGRVRYPFSAQGAGSVVRVAFGAGSGAAEEAAAWRFPPPGSGSAARVLTPPGMRSTIPVTLENHDIERRLVLLSVAPQDPDAAEGWDLAIVPSLFLRPGETRTVNLFATPAADAPLRTYLPITVRADVAGLDSAGIATRSLFVAPTLSEGNRSIHFHADMVSYGQPWDLYQPVYPGWSFSVDFLRQEGPDPPLMDPGPLGAIGSYRADGASLDPLSLPVRLLADEDALFHLELGGDVQGRLRVVVDVYDGESGSLYHHEGEHAVGRHTIPLVPRFDETVDLPVGTRLGVDLLVSRPDAVFRAGIDPARTSIELPVRQAASGVNVTDGRFLPNLYLDLNEERTTYVNPGRAYTYELVLANDGIEEDDLNIGVTVDGDPGWTASVVPGERFRVPAGQNTPFGVTVRPDEAAVEGTTGVVIVKAASKHDPRAEATLELRAVVTGGIEIPERGYSTREGQLPPLPDVEESATAALAPLMLLALGLLLWVRRRPS